MTYMAGGTVNWTGTNPDSMAGTGQPTDDYVASPGTVPASSGDLTVIWSDGFSMSFFAADDPDLVYVGYSDPGALGG